MRNLIVCCDGTWNTPDQREGGLPAPTNVVKLFNLCLEDGQQLKYYHPGIGTEGSMLRRAIDGGTGHGLDRNIQSAYHWLCRQWRPNDRVFLFGFSRGAYTVRSLSGLMLRVGLLDLTGLDQQAAWERIATAYQAGYREHRPKTEWGAGWPALVDAQGQDPDIHCIGVWDTVGARGVPDNLVWLDLLLDDPKRWRFHDTRLSPRVHHAYHAVAMDEPRSSFAPTLWTLEAPRPTESTFHQLWFPGCHSDVGGGFGNCGLSDMALQWMLDLSQTQGLRINTRLLDQLRPDPRGPLHDPLEGIWKHLRTQPRATPCLAADQVGQVLHPGTWERHEVPPIAQAPYRRTVQLGAGEQWIGNIYAHDHWNATGLWLEAGTPYRFAADGQWLDQSNPCGPEGIPNGRFKLVQMGYRLGDLLGLGEALYQRMSGKVEADWWGTKRCQTAAWFELVGMIANQADVDGGGTPPSGETFAIGRGLLITPKRSGYLYCYPNDAWSFYGNNRGSVRLEVSRG